jgi:heat shock protein HspQ
MIIRMIPRLARFAIGDLVRHSLFSFRGVVFDVDPEFTNTQAWYDSIPEDLRPAKDQPFYHVLAEAEDESYVAYVSEGNLLPDVTGQPVGHPRAAEFFSGFKNGHYLLRPHITN